MRPNLASLAALMALLSACTPDRPAPAPAAPPPLVRAPAEPASPPSEYRQGLVFPDVSPAAAPHLSTVSPLPPRAPLYQMTAPSVSAPIGAAPNPGPVTGYGAGGMGTIPGSPANPPYH